MPAHIYVPAGLSRDLFCRHPIRLLSESSTNFVKSWIDEPVEDKILEILLVDGQRGWPSLVQRLLLLNVVGSNPLHRANPEQDIPCAFAKFSIARQISSCVIISPQNFF